MNDQVENCGVSPQASRAFPCTHHQSLKNLLSAAAALLEREDRIEEDISAAVRYIKSVEKSL